MSGLRLDISKNEFVLSIGARRWLMDYLYYPPFPLVRMLSFLEVKAYPSTH
jgi:hypothetical protein